MLLGVLLIGGASIQFLSANGGFGRADPFNAIPPAAPGDPVFFESFDETLHISEDGNVNILGQIDPFLSEVLNFGELGSATVYPFYSASARKGARDVPGVVVARDDEAFQRWLARNATGNASMGDLYTIHGNVTYNGRFVAPIINWLSEKGASTPEQFVVIVPYTESYTPPPAPSRLSRLLPVTIMLLGAFCFMIGYRRLEVRRLLRDDDETFTGSTLEGLNT